MTLWNESMQLTQPQPFGILFIAPECARVLRQGNWGRGYLLVMRSWRYTSTCSKCDGSGSELQSWQENAIHDFMMELFEMIPLTFWDLGRKGIWQSLIQCINLLQPFSVNASVESKSLFAQAGKESKRLRSLRSRPDAHFEAHQAGQALPSSLQKWYVHNVSNVSHDSSILWGNSCDKYDILYSLYTIDYIHYIICRSRYWIWIASTSSHLQRGSGFVQNGENKEYMEYENDCIIMRYIYIYIQHVQSCPKQHLGLENGFLVQEFWSEGSRIRSHSPPFQACQLHDKAWTACVCLLHIK